MKIRRIGLVLSKAPGYSETFFRNKIRGLQAHGYEIILFTIDGQNTVSDALNCKVISALDFKGPRLNVFFNSLLVLVKAIVFSPRMSFRHYLIDRDDGLSKVLCIKRLIHNSFLFVPQLDWLHFGFGMLAVGRENVAAAIGAKMAVSFRGFDLYLSPLKHPECYTRLFLKRVHYHVLSQEMKRDLIAYNVSSEHIEVIPPAINIDFFKAENKSKENKTINIVTVSRLHWKKGLIYTLEALAVLKRQGLLFHYTIIGAGIEHERLVFAAHQLDLLDVVTFTGSLSPEAVKRYLATSDIYVQYSIQEGFCNAVLEAQAMGLLCIVSNAEGLSENVLHNTTGWVVPKRQPKLLARKIEDVIQMRSEDKHRIQDLAIRRVRDHFNLTNQQNAFIGFYKNDI